MDLSEEILKIFCKMCKDNLNIPHIIMYNGTEISIEVLEEKSIRRNEKNQPYPVSRFWLFISVDGEYLGDVDYKGKHKAFLKPTVIQHRISMDFQTDMTNRTPLYTICDLGRVSSLQVDSTASDYIADLIQTYMFQKVMETV